MRSQSILFQKIRTLWRCKNGKIEWFRSQKGSLILLDFVLSKHAVDELSKAGRSQIQQEWIIRTLKNPDYTDRDNRTDTLRVWKRIPEYGNRALRVVYNPNTDPITVVTIFFDRGYKR